MSLNVAMHPAIAAQLRSQIPCLHAALGLLFISALLAGCGGDGALRNPSRTDAVRILSWNIHHGEGIDGRIDLQRIANVINDAKPDLVALQEVDRGVERTQGRDLASELAHLTGLHPVFFRNITHQGGEYGNLVLSRWPIISATNHHYAMIRPGEQRGLLQVEVQSRNRRLWFWNTHIDHRPDDAERWANVGEIRERLAAAVHPVILAGDFNDFPGSRVYQGLIELFHDAWIQSGAQGDESTFPGQGTGRRIDYVWLDRRAPLKATDVRIIRSDASDHWAVLAEVQVKR